MEDHPMIASDIMTRAVLAVDPQTPIVQAITLMTTRHVSGLPVLRADGRIVGILTEGDLLRRVELGTAGAPAGWLASFLLPGRCAETYIQTHARRVGEVMTSDVITVSETTPLTEVAALMRRHRVRRLPVVRDGRLLGIVSRADLVRVVGDALASEPIDVSDSAIRVAILAAMDKEQWASARMISVMVQDGVAQLDGCIVDMRERQALEVLAETIPGVKQVENRIVCIEPYSGMVTFDPAAV
jgi:CBS domain-containing protein